MSVTLKNNLSLSFKGTPVCRVWDSAERPHLPLASLSGLQPGDAGLVAVSLASPWGLQRRRVLPGLPQFCFCYTLGTSVN